MIKFQKKTYVPGVTRNSSFFHACLVDWGDENSEKMWNLPRKDLVEVVLDGEHMCSFFEEKKLNDFEKAVVSLFQDKNGIKKVVANYQKRGNALLRAGKCLNERLTEKTYQTFLRDYKNLTAGLWLTLIAGRQFHGLLLQELRRLYPKLGERELDKLAGILTYPPRHTPLANSQISLLTIGTAIQEKRQKKYVYKLLKDHHEQYRVIPVNYNEDPWTWNDIQKQLKLLLRENCTQKLKDMRQNHTQKVQAAKNALLTLKSNKAKHYAIVLQQVSLLNEYRKFIICNASLAHQDIFRRIAKKYRLKSWRECFKLSPEEIGELYFKNNKSILSVLPRRKVISFILDAKTKSYIFYTKRESKDFLAAMKPAVTPGTNKQTKELTGRSANAGMAQGPARIILGKKDFHKFKPGDILIAPMTSVDYVPIMAQAAAFVTNEGGITSHASIVSREMNKPCIIGTKIATKIFKDGDLVELDANKGVIRKL